MKYSMSVKSQSVETSGITKDYREALCEYIWNGFEAGATQVDITYLPNELGGISELIIRDNGMGICYETLGDTFGAFLASQKNGLSLQLKSKVNKGKGRFSGFSIASSIKWSTVYTAESGNISYSITIESENKNEYELTDPEVTDADTGTTVVILGTDQIKPENLTLEALVDLFLKEFAWFLYLNKGKGLKLSICGRDISYEKYINTEFTTETKILVDGVGVDVAIIVWNERIHEKFCTYYMDLEGVVKGVDTTTFNRNTVSFNHSVFARSLYFKDKVLLGTDSDDNGQISLDESTQNRSFLRKLKAAIQKVLSEVLSSYLSKQADKAVQGMMERHSFPEFPDDIYGRLQKKELITVTKELYRLESGIFYKLKPVQEKSLLGFLKLLLNSEERENILEIVEQIVQLTPEQRRNFGGILKKTRLTNIIDAIKFIEDRYKVIEALKRIIFSLADYANERDHIQKIIEQHYWLFGEQYNLVTADQRMQKALSEYLYILYGKDAPDAQLSPDQEEMRRMDIFACGARKVEDVTGSDVRENLVVELKAPKIVLTKKVLRQIEDYMDYVRKQPNFNTQLCRWKFIAVCAEVDDDIKARYAANEATGKRGLVFKVDNYELYALTWSDVFQSFELRHSFLLDKLKMDQEAIANELKNENTAGRECVEEIVADICAV